MEKPALGTFWKYIGGKMESPYVIKIVPSEPPNLVSYAYQHSGHIGGCRSLQWFYMDWAPLT